MSGFLEACILNSLSVFTYSSVYIFVSYLCRYMCACADAYNIYIEQMPDYMSNNGRFLCRYFQFLFRIFCHWFSINWNNPMYFWVLASDLFLGVVRSTRTIFACRCPCQHVKRIWPKVSFAAKQAVAHLCDGIAGHALKQEYTIPPTLAHTNGVCAATAAWYVLAWCHRGTDDKKRQNFSHGAQHVP